MSEPTKQYNFEMQVYLVDELRQFAEQHKTSLVDALEACIQIGLAHYQEAEQARGLMKEDETIFPLRLPDSVVAELRLISEENKTTETQVAEDAIQAGLEHFAHIGKEIVSGFQDKPNRAQRRAVRKQA